MADSTVRVDEATNERLKKLAAGRGLSVRAYLQLLTRQEENQQTLHTATAAFEAAVNRPGYAEAFDAHFGGLPGTAMTTPRAA